ncbi:YcxB family protein [Candidatus Dojkabacteria bacterium]|nr:YcxB family protein [Candidatus Dojkabacteria bacterium]
MSKYTIKYELKREEYIEANKQLFLKRFFSPPFIILVIILFIAGIMLILNDLPTIVTEGNKTTINFNSFPTNFTLALIAWGMILTTVVTSISKGRKIAMQQEKSQKDTLKLFEDRIEHSTSTGEKAIALWRRFSDVIETRDFYFLKRKDIQYFQFIPKSAVKKAELDFLKSKIIRK